MKAICLSIIVFVILFATLIYTDNTYIWHANVHVYGTTSTYLASTYNNSVYVYYNDHIAWVCFHTNINDIHKYEQLALTIAKDYPNHIIKYVTCYSAKHVNCTINKDLLLPTIDQTVSVEQGYYMGIPYAHVKYVK